MPVVFVNLPDPVGAGYVKSLARPGGNATGFTNFEYGLSAKWLQLLKEVAPGVTRVAVLRDPTLDRWHGRVVRAKTMCGCVLTKCVGIAVLNRTQSG